MHKMNLDSEYIILFFIFPFLLRKGCFSHEVDTQELTMKHVNKNINTKKRHRGDLVLGMY
jgi:hypothetical protein